MIDEILNIIDEYSLGRCVQWILKHNPSQALPYHSFNHSIWVAYYADQAYRYERPDAVTPRALLLAALFHDFDHSGGFFISDGKNIMRATMGYANYVLDTFNAEMDIVESLIIETTYPHSKRDAYLDDKKESRNTDEYRFMANCLRDADFMQNCNEALLSNFVGIKEELFRSMPYAEYTAKTIEFLKSISYHTPYGKYMGQLRLNHAIERMERFQQLIFPRQDK